MGSSKEWKRNLKENQTNRKKNQNTYSWKFLMKLNKPSYRSWGNKSLQILKTTNSLYMAWLTVIKYKQTLKMKYKHKWYVRQLLTNLSCWKEKGSEKNECWACLGILFNASLTQNEQRLVLSDKWPLLWSLNITKRYNMYWQHHWLQYCAWFQH